MGYVFVIVVFFLLSLLGFAYLTGFWMEMSIKHLEMSIEI